ncbi:acyl-CoA dehydrogenase [Actinomadura craniellae]|uniref:Acyl-CoA dehydrogenase n=1 Tax=Actinomadura craniellae TaxID=2231787 RepID=A0A365HB80_9ACTN|nr:acyl-CoA dehydrogenase family protein [Actinomadura craniellae]RAY16268.1 acyl-CoA dehydrogenase [Actinomadura craniellae]
MDFAFDDEQEELRRTVRGFLRDHSPEPEVRRLMATEDGHDPRTWARLAGELGLTGLAVPEEYGGAGGGALETGVVLEEMGRALYCGPYLATGVLAVQAILAAGDPGAARELLPGIAAGVTLATVALPADGTDDTGAVTVHHSGGRWLLEGTRETVLDGRLADLLLIPAHGADGLGLYAVSGEAERLVRTAADPLDPTRKLARLDFAGTPAHPVGGPDAGGRALARVLDHAAVALAAEAVGGAQFLLDTAVEHARARIQFGRPIAAFQAVKHACADMYVEVESARSAAYYALWAAAGDSPELPAAAALAKAACSDAYAQVAAEAIQVLGGIGVTWEHPAHLYFRRAKATQLLFGDPDRHRDRLVELIG